MQPQISYLVCGTPRCGSSLLCEALKNTGIAGYLENLVLAERKLRKQADALSEDWAQQYYQLKQGE